MTWNRFSTTILPVLTLILGYIGSLVTETVRDSRAHNRNRAESRALFQRETLLALQDSMADLVRSIAQIHMDTLRQVNDEDIAWEDITISDEASDAAFLAEQASLKLAVRIADEELQKSVMALIEISHDIAVAEDRDMMHRIHGLVATAHKQSSLRIGKLLTTVY